MARVDARADPGKGRRALGRWRIWRCRSGGRRWQRPCWPRRGPAGGGGEATGVLGAEQWAWDDATGAALDPRVVADEREKEIGYIRKHGVYRKVRRSSVPKGTKVIQVRWIDINKGDEVNPDIRSRLVAKDFKTDNII